MSDNPRKVAIDYLVKVLNDDRSSADEKFEAARMILSSGNLATLNEKLSAAAEVCGQPDKNDAHYYNTVDHAAMNKVVTDKINGDTGILELIAEMDKELQNQSEEGKQPETLWLSADLYKRFTDYQNSVLPKSTDPLDTEFTKLHQFRGVTVLRRPHGATPRCGVCRSDGVLIEGRCRRCNPTGFEIVFNSTLAENAKMRIKEMFGDPFKAGDGGLAPELQSGIISSTSRKTRCLRCNELCEDSIESLCAKCSQLKKEYMQAFWSHVESESSKSTLLPEGLR